MFSQSMLDDMNVTDLAHYIKKYAIEVEKNVGPHTETALDQLNAIIALSNQLREHIEDYLEI